MSNVIAPGFILIVDDNKVNRLLLARSLEQQGHEVALAENGKQAIEILKAENFDLVLSDIEMPIMDGFTLLSQLKADVHLRNLPVIMTSALDEMDGVVRCIEMGAEDYLIKPVNAILLRARINASLEKKRLRDEQLALVRRFATSEVVDDLTSSGFSLGGKLIDASAMFSDIRSFTTLTESQSPEETIELLNTYYTLMFEAINGHGGVVNQMVGDGLMAIFGAPLPQEDHCERAVLAALEMIEMVGIYNLERIALHKVEIRIGIGIASGQVVAGYTGTRQRATYTAVGDVVNLAARLEAHTKVLGQPILIDANTQKALEGHILVQSQGLIQFKGKTVNVEIFSVPVN